MVRRKSVVTIDWILLSVFISIVFIGWLMLYASCYEGTGFWFDLSSPIGRQTIWLGISFFVFIAIINIDWRIWNSLSYPIYVLAILMLIAVLIFGKEIKGATSWFNIMGFSLQPSEFAKTATAMAIASFLSKPGTNLNNNKHIAISLAIFAIPAMLIFIQPDAGTAMIYLAFMIPLFRAGMNASLYIVAFTLAFIFIGSLLWTPYIMLLIVLVSSYLFLGLGAKQRRLPISLVTLLALFCLSVFNFLQYGYLLLLLVLSGFYFYFIAFRAGKYREILIALSLTVSSIALSFGTQWAFDNVLKPHQRARINVWLKPQLSDPKGELYNIIQSKTAIGSGGFSGKGFLNGTMTKLNYVPEQNTDFVFSILGEEQGFIGSISLIFLFTIMLFRISHIAERSNFLYIKYFSYAIAGIFFLHFFINIGMTMGIMPVIGIPLPLISKGGSSFLSFTIMIAMILKMDLARSRQ